MRLLADDGYEGAGNAAVAEAAGLTRGAMLYHFPTRESLIEAAALHIQAQRASLFEREAAKAAAGVDAVVAAIDAYWKLISTEPFVAFAALETAAKSDLDVAKAIRPAQEAFDRASMGESLPGFIQAGADPRFQASRDLARFALDGLSRATLTYDQDKRVETLLNVIKRAVHILNRKGHVTGLWED